MKKFFRFLVFAFALILAVAGCIPAAASGTKAESCIERIVDYNLKKTSSASVQDWIDGYLTENIDSGTEWYIIALSNYSKYDFTSYKKALVGYLSENEIGSASSRLKFALALIAAGERNSPFITDFLENSAGEQGIMSYIFALHILNNGYSCEKYSKKDLTDELLSLQSADGGWSLTGRNGDVDVTAMTVQALASQYSSNTSVRNATDKALTFLSSRQNADGTYSSYGISNPESVSQVIIALSALGIDAEKDTRFIKNSKTLFDALEVFNSADGSYSHQLGKESDETATVQVFCAATAYEKMKKVKSPFYIFAQQNSVTAEKPKEEKSEPGTTQKTDVADTTSAHEDEQVSLTTQTTSSAVVSTQPTQAAAEKQKKNNADNSYKIWIIVAIIVVAVSLCAGLILTKRIKLKGCIIVIAVAVCAILIVVFTNIKPADDELSEGKEDTTSTVTISIRCDTVKGNSSLPENGVILEETKIQMDGDDTVYDVLSRACKENDIHLEITGAKETLYVEGICNLYEKDYGELSGWVYFVNGESPSVGCAKYNLSDEDEIVWCYTCDLGEDIDIDSFAK